MMEMIYAAKAEDPGSSVVALCVPKVLFAVRVPCACAVCVCGVCVVCVYRVRDVCVYRVCLPCVCVFAVCLASLSLMSWVVVVASVLCMSCHAHVCLCLQPSFALLPEIPLPWCESGSSETWLVV